MMGRLHGDYFIMASPSFDTATSGWVPQSDVSWNHKSPCRKFAFIRFPNRFNTEAQAIAFALAMTGVWIDKNRRRLAHPGLGSERANVIDVVETLKTGFPNRATRHLRESHSQSSLTFEQFKFVITARLNISENLLRKSYAALVGLRKNRHLSWAETRRKMERSREEVGAGESPTRRPKAAPIPLTKRDWQKIG